MALQTYRELVVWQKAMDLMIAIYEYTNQLPADERYGLKAQMKSAALSIPSNIAEGYGRLHRGDYVHHLSMARGSLAELETQMIASVRLGLAKRESTTSLWELSQDVSRLLDALIDSLRPEKYPKPPAITP
jgi:four helix bundle protein